MDTTLKMTRQGIRDLNSYGPRPKPVAADGAAPAEGGVMPVVAGGAAPEAVDSSVPTGVAGKSAVTSPDAGSS